MTAPKRLSAPVRMNLTVENLVSGEKLTGKYPVQGVTRHTVQFVELIPEGIVLDVPTDFCGQGEKLKMDISTEDTVEPVRVQVQCRVSKKSFEKGNVSRDSIWLEFGDTPGWQQIRAIFIGRQNEVRDIFARYKGNET